MLFVLSAGFSFGQVLVVNMIPNSQSDEENQDSEPNIAVNPANPLQIAGSAFTPDPLGGANAPIYISTDGGNTWAFNSIVPSSAGSMTGTGDITIRFGGTSDILYSGILRLPGFLRLNILRTFDFTNAAPMDVLVDRNNIDQPYIQAATVMGGSGSGKDRVYVGDNDFAALADQTATIDLSLDAAVVAPVFNTARIETRATAGQDFPPIRPIIHANGTVYAVFYGWRSGTYLCDVVVVRDDNWGSGATPFTDLVDTGDGLAGVRVVQDRNIPFENYSHSDFGQERFVGSNLSIAVDPGDSNTVYIVWADRVGVDDYTLHVRHSADGGSTWDASDLRTITNATNPALAINSHGKVGFLYQAVTGAVGNQRWETHFERTDDEFSTINDIILADVPAGTPTPPQFIPYIGDYVHVMAVGKNFYGIFSANNTPDNANFPNGVTYQRNADFATHTLLQLDNVTPVDISIDPFFFKVTELAEESDFYVSDWNDSAASYDTGLEPSTHPVFYTTSDVWNRRSDAPGGFNANNQPQSEDPQMTSVGTNYAFARIRRNATGTAETVTAHFLVSEFGCGSNYLDAGVAPDPTINFNAADGEITMSNGYAWELPVTTSTHTCLAVEISTPSDPIIAPSVLGHAPGWPTTDLMFINDNNKAQRNMGVYTLGGYGTVPFYGIAHNAATFPRDMVIKYTVPKEALKRLKRIHVEVIGGDFQSFGNSITLPNMQPGENRWLQLSFDVPEGSDEELLPVYFHEMVGSNAVNGFAIAAKPSPMAKVIRKNLEFHAQVLFRLSVVCKLPKAREEALKALEWKRPDIIRANDYIKFLSKYTRPPLERMPILTCSLRTKDPFGIKASVDLLYTELKTGELKRIAPVHAALLHKVDASLTMMQKTKGDPADIHQNVRWQKKLYSTVPVLEELKITRPLLEKSEKFIVAYSQRKIGIKDYPAFIRSLIPEFHATARALGKLNLQLMEDILKMKLSLKSPTALQKAHRQFLLKLQSLKK